MKKYNRIMPEGETVFVGIDLHRLSWHITVICGEEVIFSGAHPPEPEKLLSFLKRYRPNRIEASCIAKFCSAVTGGWSGPT